MNNQNSLDELKRKVYFYGDLCAHFQGECEFGKASVDKRNSNIREAGDELLAAINKTIMESLPKKRELIEPVTKRVVTDIGSKVGIDLDTDLKGSLKFIQDNGYNQAISDMEQAVTKKYGRADNEKV